MFSFNFITTDDGQFLMNSTPMTWTPRPHLIFYNISNHLSIIININISHSTHLNTAYIFRIKNTFFEINKALNQHYTNKVDHLQGQIDGLQNSDLKAHTTSSNLALKKHRLTTKFSLDTVTQFKTISEARLTKNDSQLPHSTKTQPTHVNELNWQSPKNVSRPLLKDLTFNLDISNPFEILTLQASTSHEDPQIMNPAKKTQSSIPLTQTTEAQKA